MPRWILIVRGRLDERLKAMLNGAGFDALTRQHAGLGQDRYTHGFAVGIDAPTADGASVKLEELLPEGYEITDVLPSDSKD